MNDYLVLILIVVGMTTCCKVDRLADIVRQDTYKTELDILVEETTNIGE